MYQISSLGRVKSLKYRQERLMKPNNCDGYLSVDLLKEGKRKHLKVHRLVAQAFIPNPDNKPCIDHIDTNPSNNSVSNLRWASYSENNENPLTRIHMSGENSFWNGKCGREHCRSKKVVQLDLEGNFIKVWDSAADVQRIMGICYSSVSYCCSGRYKHAGGYKWIFFEDYQKKAVG